MCFRNPLAAMWAVSYDFLNDFLDEFLYENLIFFPKN